MSRYRSKRAEILRKVLDYINQNDWTEENGFMIFGKEAFQSWSETLHSDEHDLKTGEALREFATTWTVGQGKRALARRVKLGVLPEDSTVSDAVQLLTRLIPGIDERKARKSLANSLPGVARLTKDSELDCIDAALATDLVLLLEGSFARISSYEEMPVRLPNPKVQRYFDEAHRCYLFGLDVGCAVLCRAIMEAALIERVDPKEQLKPPRGKNGGSHILNMIEKAKGRFLTDEAPGNAKEIKEAGDVAIHSLSDFRAKYSKRMGEIVDNTRKILIDLYS